jgi:hypothetical protein
MQGLARFVQGASAPAGYGRFLRLGQVWNRYGASRADRHRAMRFLRRADGVRTVEMGTTGTAVMATMTPDAARRLFCARGSRPPHGHLCRPRPLRGTVRHVVVGEVYAAGGAQGSAPARHSTATGTPQGCAEALESGTFTPNQISAATEADQLAARARLAARRRLRRCGRRRALRRPVNGWGADGPTNPSTGADVLRGPRLLHRIALA